MDPAQELAGFLDNTVARSTLGVVYGRRRIGKSTLLVTEARRREGFYYEATRVETPLQLERLGAALGRHLGVGRLSLSGWDEAFEVMLNLGTDGPTPVVLDEFGHVLEADRSVDSVVATALGPDRRQQTPSQARLVLCGSAIAMMRSLTAGEAPLRGRAGIELIMYPDDHRVAATRLPNPNDLATAARVFAVIGGVVGYATDMVDFDLPDSADDFDRWVAQRVLSPAATLHHEATTLLAEDPVLASRDAMLHHSVLGAIANGSITAGSIARRVGRQVSNLAPSLARLVDAGFVVRHEDPIRDQRPLYALADPFLQFHHAVLDPHRALLRDRNPVESWSGRLADVFGSQVRGPVFEEQARSWVRRFASDKTLPVRDHIGPSQVSVDGVSRQVDVVVAGSGSRPGERPVVAIGEAKAGETLGTGHVRQLERTRAALGARAAGAKLLLFGASVDRELEKVAAGRSDLEVVDLDRLYHGD